MEGGTDHGLVIEKTATNPFLVFFLCMSGLNLVPYMTSNIGKNIIMYVSDDNICTYTRTKLLCASQCFLTDQSAAHYYSVGYNAH